jgi:hypothetical protein
MIAEKRASTFFTEYKLLTNRTLVYIYRNPRNLKALFGLSLFMSFLISSTFHGIGAKEYEIDWEHPLESFYDNFATAFGWVGLCFFLISDCFISMTFAQVL